MLRFPRSTLTTTVPYILPLLLDIALSHSHNPPCRCYTYAAATRCTREQMYKRRNTTRYAALTSSWGRAAAGGQTAAAVAHQSAVVGAAHQSAAAEVARQSAAAAEACRTAAVGAAAAAGLLQALAGCWVRQVLAL